MCTDASADKARQVVVRGSGAVARYVLGVDLWEREVDILRSVQRNRRTAIKSCHGAGKTFTLAILLLWWLTRHQEGIVLTTSPTLRQVKTQLWSEIHRMVTHTRIPYPKLNQTELKLRGEDNFALGFSTNQGERFQGFHGRAVLLIVDEAPGIEASIWDPIAGTMAGGKVHMIMAGNPTVPSGAFYDAFTRERALWNCITIDAFDSPNLKGLSLEQLLETDPTDGSPLDQNPVPYLVTRRWVYDQFKVWWHWRRGQFAQLDGSRARPVSPPGAEFVDQTHMARTRAAATTTECE